MSRLTITNAVAAATAQVIPLSLRPAVDRRMVASEQVESGFSSIIIILIIFVREKELLPTTTVQGGVGLGGGVGFLDPYTLLASSTLSESLCKQLSRRHYWPLASSQISAAAAM